MFTHVWHCIICNLRFHSLHCVLYYSSIACCRSKIWSWSVKSARSSVTGVRFFLSLICSHCLCVTSLRSLNKILPPSIQVCYSSSSQRGCFAFKNILMSVPARKFFHLILQCAHERVVITLSVSYLPQMCPLLSGGTPRQSTLACLRTRVPSKPPNKRRGMLRSVQLP